MRVYKKRPGITAFFFFLLVLGIPSIQAAESLEFISEHLPETAADNRYATLPLATASVDQGHFLFQSGYSMTESSRLRLSGSQLSLGYHFPFRRNLGLEFVGFSDAMRFSGGNVTLPLEVLFSDDIPLSLPAQAAFGRLQGSMHHWGVGVFVDRDMHLPVLGDGHAAFGIIGEVFRLKDYRAAYRIISGENAGVTGIADYSATYRFITPMMQFARGRNYGDWKITPKATVALPLPRVGVKGRLTGPGFDISGDTADNGEGKHYGDFSLTLSFLAVYRPWHLSFDLGGLVTQALLEPVIHKGIEQNWILSVRWEG